MGLRLHTVAPRQGAKWIVQAFALWRKRPLAFVSLFMFFLFGVLMLMLLPLVGPLLGLGMLPMLTLGFMIATRSALQDGPVNVLQIAEGLRVPDRSRRLSQLLLCGVYALGSIGVMELSAWIDEGLFEKLQMAMATPNVKPEVVNALLLDPRLANGMLARLGLAALLSVPFWHAPALVHWGGQGVVQALFSSTLALWRAKGAFTVYALCWLAVTLGLGLLATLLVLLLGSRQIVSLLAMPAGLIVSALFYVSLWFSFSDSFGDDDPAPGSRPRLCHASPPRWLWPALLSSAALAPSSVWPARRWVPPSAWPAPLSARRSRSPARWSRKPSTPSRRPGLPRRPELPPSV